MDEFLAAEKRLKGTLPQWQDASRSGEKQAIWDVEESDGRVRAHFRFRCGATHRAYPSMSLIFRGQPIWRADMFPPTASKLNLPAAAMMSLPPRVFGSHEHRWDDNRAYVLQEDWTLPLRRPLPPQIQRLPQLYPDFAAKVKVLLDSDQYDFDVPRREDLFEWGDGQ